VLPDEPQAAVPDRLPKTALGRPGRARRARLGCCHRIDRGTTGVQGYIVDRATPEGEALVEIPAELLLEAARALGG
jgi:hypothetical protein